MIFEVIEKPILHYVKYVGPHGIGKKSSAEEAKVKPGDAMDPFAVEDARRAIEDHYHSHGFPRARVTIIEGNKPTDRGAIFLVNEGQKQAVLWTDFVGNTIVSQARLRTQIKSTPGYFWLFGGNVERKEIDEDINRLTAYYRSMGFFDCRIGRQLHYNDAQDWLLLTFVIQEGPRYQVRNVSFLGNTKFPTGKLAEMVKLKNTTVEPDLLRPGPDEGRRGGDPGPLRQRRLRLLRRQGRSPLSRTEGPDATWSTRSRKASDTGWARSTW